MGFIRKAWENSKKGGNALYNIGVSILTGIFNVIHFLCLVFILMMFGLFVLYLFVSFFGYIFV